MADEAVNEPSTSSLVAVRCDEGNVDSSPARENQVELAIPKLGF